MRVARITAIPLIAPLERPWRTGVASFDAFYTTLVRVETDDGIVGHGECLARYAPSAWAELVERVLAPLVIGRDPFDVERTWEVLYRTLGSFSGHSRGLLLEAIAGIDIALWDVRGLASGVSIARLLGGSAESIAAYASSITVDEPAIMVAQAERFVAMGFTAMKVKIGRSAREERTILTEIRRAIGEEIDLCVDANGAYDYPQAVEVAAVLEDLGVTWFEEPVRTEHRLSYGKLRSATRMALAAGEGEFTRWGIHDLLRTEAIDIVQPDVCRSGGITETRKIADLATLYHARYAPHVGASGALCAAASVHLAAATPNFLTYECSVPANPLRDELALEPVGHARDVRNGKVAVPNRPGLGIEIDERVVERYRVDR
jgi:D-galactarolactone cycloisomerase